MLRRSIPLFAGFSIIALLAGCSQDYKSGEDTGIGSSTDSDTETDTDSDADSDADSDSDSDSDTDTDTDSDSDSDSDADADTDTDTDTDTDPEECPPSAVEWAWVVQTLEVGSSTVGMDLDGDGTVDNVMSLAASSMNTAIADAIAESANVLIMQFWGVDDWCNDDVTGGLGVGEDTDGDTSDNGSGAESFDADLDGSGHMSMNDVVTVSGSTWSATIPSAEITVAGYSFVPATPIYMSGVASETNNAGLLGFGLDKELVREILDDNGWDGSLADSLADLDTDGDGVTDAVSAGFSFDATVCTVY